MCNGESVRRRPTLTDVVRQAHHRLDQVLGLYGILADYDLGVVERGHS